MTYFHSKNFLKYSLLILISYNLIALIILFVPSKSLKLKFWGLTPYDYTHIMSFPNNYNKKSLLNEFNRNEINSILNKNINSNNDVRLLESRATINVDGVKEPTPVTYFNILKNRSFKCLDPLVASI